MLCSAAVVLAATVYYSAGGYRCTGDKHHMQFAIFSQTALAARMQYDVSVSTSFSRLLSARGLCQVLLRRTVSPGALALLGEGSALLSQTERTKATKALEEWKAHVRAVLHTMVF